MFAVMMPFLIGIMNLSTVAVVWFGGLRIDSGGMPIGNLSAFLLYMIQILLSLMMGVIVAVMLPRAAAAAERIQAVLDTEPDLCDPDEPVETDGVRGLVAFRDVEFRYPGAEDAVLSGIDFTALPGQITAIVGGTGSGKTTLVNLIPRFYDVTSGSVPIDGVDVRQVRQEDLWRLIGVVPQKAYLFSGTVASNLRYGDESAGDDALWKALETAQARDFVAEMRGRARGGDRPGRDERLRRAAPAPGHRPGDRQAAPGLHLRRQLLRPRLQDGRAPSRRSAAGDPRRHGDHRGPARQHDHARRPDRRPRRRPRSSARGRTSN